MKRKKFPVIIHCWKMGKWFKLLGSYFISATLGIYLAVTFVPYVSFTSRSYYDLLLIGGVLSLLEITLKPLVKIFTTPLRIVSFGILGLLINMFFVWGITILFPSLHIPLITPLLLTTLIISALSLFLSLIN